MKKILDKVHCPNWICLLLALVLVLRIPSFFEPYSYGDEAIYLAVGEGIRKEIPLYSSVYDNKPPLLYLVAAISGSLFWFKAVLAFWNLITITAFWHLAKRLFPEKERVQKISTLIFAILTTIPLFEGNIANAEVFMIGPTIAAFLILLGKRQTFFKLLSAGFLFSFATLFKVPAVFDMGVILFFWLATTKVNLENFKKVVVKTFVLLLGFSIPIVLSLTWFYFQGTLRDYLDAAFLQNIGYLSSWRPGDTQKPFFTRNLPLFARSGVLLVSIGVLFIKRSKISKQFLFISFWLLFGLFAALLSERPYPHYLVQVVPSISFLLAILLVEKNIEQSLVILPLALFSFCFYYYKFLHYPTVPYYQRFIKFAVKQIDRDAYFASFGPRVVRNYVLSDFLFKSTKRDEKIYVWGPDNSVVYALTRLLPPGKYVADYHINDFSSKSEVVSTLENERPGFIVILPDSQPFPELRPFLRKYYLFRGEVAESEVWRLIKRKVSE